jgi:uroporphyrinogen decarboxylase
MEAHAMTQLELFNKAVSREYTGRFLFRLNFIDETKEKFLERYGLPEDISFGERFGAFEPCAISLTPPDDLPRRDFTRYFKDVDIPPNAFINHIGVLEIPGSKYHFTRYVSPLRNAETVEECRDFPFADYYGWSDEGMAEKVREAHLRGLVAVGGSGHQYEDAWQIRGYTEFLMDMVSNPQIPFFILGRIHDKVLKNVIALAKAGVDMIQTGDDVATQRALIMSPDMWRRFIKPLQREINEVAHAINPKIKMFYHSDGDISSILSDLAEIGVDILNPVQPECMDLSWIKKEYGRHFIFDGTIGTQSTMPFGTPAEVRRVIAENKRLYGYDGGLIISPTHVLEPEVPPENIMAFLEECYKI